MTFDPHDPKDPELIAKMGADAAVRAAWQRAFDLIAPYRYAYNWSWLGRPVIQFPQDLVAMQEIVWRTRPEVIVETGIAHGGSLVFSASMLALLGGRREAIGIDVEIRPHNRRAIEQHPMASRIVMFEGSSIDPILAAKVRARVGNRPAMIVLDSNHTADHVARELDLYAPLVRTGHYLIVFDTAIEIADPAHIGDRPWGPGNNPMTAVNAFLAREPRFAIDPEYDAKLLLTVAPRGYLRALHDAEDIPLQTPAPRPALTCRTPRERDVPLLATLRNDLPAQYALLASPKPNSFDDVRRWIDRRTSDPDTLFFVIADASDEPIGFAQIIAIDANGRHGTLGIAIAERFRGRGYGQAALARVFDAARADGRIDKLVLQVGAGNERARALYTSAGFRNVGTLERHYHDPGGWHDVVVMERILDIT